MSELLIMPDQPYPGLSPWLDLRPHLESSWQMDSSAWHFRALVDSNTAELHMRTRLGTSTQLVPPGVLPDEVLPAGQELIPAWAQRHGTIRIFFERDGEMHIATNNANVADGNEYNLIIRYRYQRRPQ